MMKKVYLLIVAALVTGTMSAQIAAWDFTGENAVATSTAEVYDANMDASSSLTRGSTATQSAGANSFRTLGFQNNGISVANTDYFQFTLSATTGYSLSLSTIDTRVNGTSTYSASPGVDNQYAYSLDGINFTLIGSPSVVIGSNQTFQVDLTGVAALQNVAAGVTVTFRYYASGQTSTGGWGYFSDAANSYGLAIGGTLTLTGGGCSDVPTTPASFGTITPADISADINVSAGNGTGRIIKINTTNSFTPYTTGNALPSANTVYGGGEQVVYAGSGSSVSVTGLTASTTYYVAVYEYCDNGGPYYTTAATTSFATASTPVIVGPGDILINQLSPDYGAATDEYVELVNTTNNTYDLSTVALRYQSSGGVSGPAGGTLSGILLPHHYWLLSPNGTVTVGLTNLTSDGSINAGFAGTAGQVALVRISDNAIIDGVGYGTVTGGTYYEGTASAPPPTNGGIKRVTDGVDTDNNSVDFTTVDNANILLRNSLSMALPVNFSNVKAYAEGNAIRIDWSNLTETDVNHYTVERSASSQFADLGSVNANRNDGGKASYTYLDAAPLSGVSFYRIRSEEFNGKVLYSAIVKVDTRGGATDVVLYPNPTTGGLISMQATALDKGIYTIQVFNTSGQRLLTQSLNHPGGFVTQTIQLPALQSGMYSLQLSGGATRISKSFIVR